MKKCPNCETEKEESKFHKDRRRQDGLCCWCKDCKKGLAKNYYKNNKEKVKSQTKDWKRRNPEKVKQYRKDWKKKNPKKQRKIWRDYYRNNPSQRINKNLQSRLWFLLKEGQESDSLLKLLGLSIDEFKEYLERQFYGNMTWNNYGTYWHIDHIIPCSSYNQQKQHEREECWFYTNLQPLTKKDNLKKADNVQY